MKRHIFSYKTIWVFTFFCISLILFSFARFYLFLSNRAYFAKLPVSEVIWSHIHGIRFDISIILTVIGPFLIMLLLPVFKKGWLWFWGVVSSLVFVMLYLMVWTDVIFFAEATHHIGNEVWFTMEALEIAGGFAIGDYLLLVIFLFALFFLYLFTINLVVKKLHQKRPGPSIKIVPVKFVLLVLFIYFGVNGKIGFTGNGSLTTSDAFLAHRPEAARLVINGPFNTLNVVKKYFAPTPTNHYDPSVVRQLQKGNVIKPHEQVVDSNYPLMRKVKEGQQLISTNKKLNVFVVMLESWSARFCDSFSGEQTGLTPNFDRIAKEGIKFTNFYSNGMMSVLGMSSILGSITHVTKFPLLGKGLERKNIYKIGFELERAGYSTLFLQSPLRRAFRVDEIADHLGFKQYYGAEDFSSPEVVKKNANGQDHDMFNFAKLKIDEIKKPFFTFTFTGTTHVPYMVPEKRFEKLPHGENSDEGFKNTLYYADYSLGEFFKQAEKMPWFEDTIFVLTADHTLRRNVIGKLGKIPLVIYAPKYLKPKIIDVLGSQMDIVATLAHLGVPINYTGFGTSLFTKNGDSSFMYYDSPNIGLNTNNGHIVHDSKQLLDSTLESVKDTKEKEKLLLSTEQYIIELIESNKFYR